MDFIVFGLLLVGGFVLGWGLGIAGWVKAGRLEQRVATLERRLAEAGLPAAAREAPAAATEAGPPAPAAP
ncbi:hypothetical protein JYK14_28390, partial [Siccirubricoccus sp. KC 17139]